MRRVLALGLVLALAPVASAQLGIPRSPAPTPQAFAPVTVLNMAQRNAGTYSFSGQAVQTGIVGASLQIDVSQATDPLPSMSGTLEGSLDSGTTWMPAGSFGPRPTGPKGNDLKGQPLTIVFGQFGGGTFWTASTNPNRQLRGSATLGGSMRFALVVQPL